MPTIKDVASESGVSRGTVSRVLNNGSVSQKSKKAVLIAIDKLGYKPNIAAQLLRCNKSNLVGLIIPSFSGGFFGDVMHVLQNELMEDNKTLIVVEGRDNKRELKAIQHLISMGCDGLILDARYSTNNELISILQKSKIPSIIFDRFIPEIAHLCVYYDHYAAAKNLTLYLKNKGHKNILCLAGLVTRLNSKFRQDGYIDSMRESALTPVVINGQYHQTFGYESIKKTFSTLENTPSAIICCSETVAAGAIQACHDIGLQIPQQLEIVSFDSDSLCHLLTPIIPSSKFPILEMSQRAAKKLKKIMKGEKCTEDVIFSPLPIS